MPRSRESKAERRALNQARHQAIALRGIACALRRVAFRTLAFKVVACRLEQIAGQIERTAGPRRNAGPSRSQQTTAKKPESPSDHHVRPIVRGGGG